MGNEQSGARRISESTQVRQRDTHLQSSSRPSVYSGNTPTLATTNQVSLDGSKQLTADRPQLQRVHSNDVLSPDVLRLPSATASVSSPPANSPSAASSPEASPAIGAIPIILRPRHLSDFPLAYPTVSEDHCIDEQPTVHHPGAQVNLDSTFPNETNTVWYADLTYRNIPVTSTAAAAPLAPIAVPARSASGLISSVSTDVPSNLCINVAASKMDTISDGDDSSDLPELVPMSSDSEGSGIGSTLMGSKEKALKSSPDLPISGSNTTNPEDKSKGDQYCDVHDTQVAVCVCRHCRRLLCQNCQASKAWCDATTSDNHVFLSIGHGATQFSQELEKAVEERSCQMTTVADRLSKKVEAQSSLDKNILEVSDAVCTEFDSIINILQAERDFRLAELLSFKARCSKQLNASTSSLQEALPELSSSTAKGKLLIERLRAIESEMCSYSEACTALRDSVEILEDLATNLLSFTDEVKPVGHFEYSPQRKVGKTELCSRLDALTGTLSLFSSRGEFLRAWGEEEEYSGQVERQEPCDACVQRAEDDLRTKQKEAILRVDKATSTDYRQQKNKSNQTASCNTREKGTATVKPSICRAERPAEVKIEYVYLEHTKQSDAVVPFNYVFPPTTKEFDHCVDNSKMEVVFDAVVPRYKHGPFFTVGPDGIYESVSANVSSLLFSGWTGGICASSDGNLVFATSGSKKGVVVYGVDASGHLHFLETIGIAGAKSLRGICYRPEDGSLVIADTQANKLIIIKESHGIWQHVTDVKFDRNGMCMFRRPLFVTSAGLNHLYVTGGPDGLVAICVDPPEIIWKVALVGAWTVSGSGDRVFVTHGRPTDHKDAGGVPVPLQRVSVISTVDSGDACSRVIRTFDGPNRRAVRVCPKGDGSGQVMLLSSYR